MGGLVAQINSFMAGNAKKQKQVKQYQYENRVKHCYPCKC